MTIDDLIDKATDKLRGEWDELRQQLDYLPEWPGSVWLEKVAEQENVLDQLWYIKNATGWSPIAMARLIGVEPRSRWLDSVLRPYWSEVPA